MLTRKFNIRCIAALSLIFLTLSSFVNGQSPRESSKEKEKQTKEDARRQKQDDKAKALLEKLVPIGKDIDYDRFKDITTVNTKWMVVHPMDRDIRFETSYVGMWAVYSIQGQFGTLPPSIRLFFYGQTLLIGTPGRPCSLSMILNGADRVQFGQMNYGSTIRLGNIAWVDMSLNSFRTIANSKSVEVQTCRFETALNPRHILGLGALLEGLPAATTAETSKSPVEPLHPFAGTWKFQVIRDGMPEDWLLRIEKNGTLLSGVVTTPKAEIVLQNIISGGSIFSGSATELVAGGINMMTFTGQVAENTMSGKLTIYLAGRQQPIVPFQARRVSIP